MNTKAAIEKIEELRSKTEGWAIGYGSLKEIIQALGEPEPTFKVGDEVKISGVITEIDEKTKFPIRVAFGDAEWQRVREYDLEKA